MPKQRIPFSIPTTIVLARHNSLFLQIFLRVCLSNCKKNFWHGIVYNRLLTTAKLLLSLLSEWNFGGLYFKLFKVTRRTKSLLR
ncbi:hypothetical protein PUN28_009082 [Cardiocondyla obscurior]|uniref:Uncharacterized protein n=1 Tax=Cardiocondyla obscurior TaxID=286306 RepID=A0AAW2FW57_9HYME